MNSRERILTTLNHEEPDQIPFDLAGSPWTGITNTAYQNLRIHLGLEKSKPEWSDVIQQIVIPSEKVLDKLQVDSRGVFPLTSHNWDVYSKLKDVGEYFYTEISNGNMVTVERERPVLTAGSTLYIKKMDFAKVLIGQATAAELFESGRARIEGNQNLLKEILPNLDDFDPAFEILPLLK